MIGVSEKSLAVALVMVLAIPERLRAQGQPPAPASQNASPMVEHTRRHERIQPRELDGIKRTFDGPMGKPVELFLPAGARATSGMRLVIHFLGAPFIPEYAVSHLGADYMVAVVSIGAGSGLYDRAFSDPAVYDSLLASITREASAALQRKVSITQVTLSGFSAGHGAIRAILRDSGHFARVDAVLLLDGLHTSYVPEGTVMDKGGTLDEHNLEVWVRFGRAAIRGEKRFLITHSEIFPGTFASTTETTDYLVTALGLTRTPVLQWGPRGLQQLSEARQGGLEIMGFAGNSAPDHIDQFQGMPEFLKQLEARR
ncbi:MAG: hypothetical protein ABJE47_13155 [bacterium]